MQNSESHEDHEVLETSMRILDMVAARYDLQIQLHAEELRRLKQKQRNELQAAPNTPASDFVIRPRRAA
jgi:hypothetical protein